MLPCLANNTRFIYILTHLRIAQQIRFLPRRKLRLIFSKTTPIKSEAAWSANCAPSWGLPNRMYIRNSLNWKTSQSRRVESLAPCSIPSFQMRIWQTLTQGFALRIPLVLLYTQRSGYYITNKHVMCLIHNDRRDSPFARFAVRINRRSNAKGPPRMLQGV